MARDPFEQLREFSWRGIGVPVISTRLVLRQDLAQHRYVGRPGAEIEATGRAPFEISAEIPFLRHLTPGPRESWKKGALYPDVWKKMLAAMADTSTGDLQHPELGIIKCKPHTFDAPLDAKVRGGVMGTATWIETTEDPNALSALIAAVSPLAGALQAAKDIDRHLTTITPPLPTPKVKEPSFDDMMRSIQGVFDQVTLMQKRVGGTIDNILYRVNNIERSMNAALHISPNSSSQVKNWPMRDACARMKSAMRDLKKQLLTGSKPIGIYIPGRSATMGKIAADIPTDIGSLMNLNPSLLARPIVPANSKIRHYLAA
jgi:hypothetical protein